MPGEFDSFDVGAASASIASDLGFGGSAPDAGLEVSPSEPPAQTEGTATPAPAPAAAPPTTPPPAPEPWRTLPKAWKKEMESVYGQLTPEAMQYIHEREADVSRGFQQYRDSHERWNQLTTPFNDVLQQYPDVNPVELMQNLMQSHLTLIRGTPEQKQEIARHLLSAYGIDLGAPPDSTSAVAELQRRLDAYESRERKAHQDRQVAEVTAFMNDPANKHAKTVVDSMIRLLKGGVPTLKEAYEQACWLDPKVRSELVSAEQAAAQAAATAVNRLNKSTPESPSHTAPRKVKSWEDGVDEIASKYTNGPKH